MSTSAAPDKTPSAEELLVKAILVQVLESGFTPNPNQLAEQLSLNKGTAQKQWSRFTIKMKKVAEDAGKPIVIPEVRVSFFVY